MQNDTTQAHTLPVTGTINSRIGPLAFEGGYPTDESVIELYEEIDFQRAVEDLSLGHSFSQLRSVARTARAGLRRRGRRPGFLRELPRQARPANVQCDHAVPPRLPEPVLDRPLVIDVPAGQIAGAILDFWQRPVADLGLTGPDMGAGGKYLLLGPGQEVDDTSGYIVVQAPMNNIMHGIRVLLPAPEEAKRLREAYQVYPYSKREDPPRTRIVTPDGKHWEGWHPAVWITGSWCQNAE